MATLYAEPITVRLAVATATILVGVCWIALAARQARTSLHPAVKHFLERCRIPSEGRGERLRCIGCKGWAARAAGHGRNEARLNLDLLRYPDEVWLTIPATRRGRDRILGFDACVG